MFLSAIRLLAIFAFHALGDTPSEFARIFPPVNLGYAIHKPTYINITSYGLAVAKYNNIRYAQPPVGDLRFRKPKTPPPQVDGIQDGTRYPSTDCVSSAYPGVPFSGRNGTTWGQEDCLFLNVQVPEGVKEGDLVPVLHWIHGSGYAFGSKDSVGITVDPEGLFDRLQRDGKKFVFVASNYRLGLYGWMSSPGEDMTANIGLHDSLAAVQWTKEHISKFGGDSDRITVIGQSAGAGIVNLMLTSYGGKGDLPFSQAVVQSPAIMPRRDVASRRQDVYNQVLKSTSCTNLTCLRAASPEVLKAANHHLIVEVPTGTGGTSFGPGVGFSPLVDGDIIPDEPMVLLEQGRYHKEVKRVIAANTAFEGNGLSSDTNMPDGFPDYVRINFPTASDETIQRIQNLFPYPPSKPEMLAWDWITSVVFACHSTSIAKAYGSKAYRYVMRIPPATHALDLLYFFFVDNTTTPVLSEVVARQAQGFLGQFIHGKDQKNGSLALLGHQPAPEWLPYGSRFHTMDIVEHGFELKIDPWETNGICRTLLDIVKDPRNGN
ncbi:putative Carboxylesterase [Trichophyton interdigitale]|uniref:Carboxylic ester hydrolase n=1 Tax=Trichophyton interdigitale TaxID=101480 RepID=A0A9P4YMK0_9EURO|nr:putative Carboxylesterase [Trichophyton interdigitale]KAF3900709.1 putative Carboxylesterase [Trichophyton interdigitale]KAG8211608.1 putative Carboxylesterase [Trichophyton interdigitale]